MLPLDYYSIAAVNRTPYNSVDGLDGAAEG